MAGLNDFAIELILKDLVADCEFVKDALTSSRIKEALINYPISVLTVKIPAEALSALVPEERKAVGQRHSMREDAICSR